MLQNRQSDLQACMGLPVILEIYQLAIGPSTVFTTAAFRIGQLFREVLIASPYATNNRILIELSGDFARLGRDYHSDQAVIAGLGGFTIEGSNSNLVTFYQTIKANGYFLLLDTAWPFNPESDLTYNEVDNIQPNTNRIRFHLIDANGKLIHKTDYFATSAGHIMGYEIPDKHAAPVAVSPTHFSDIKKILKAEGITLLDYILSGECSRHRISRDQLQARMIATWKLMKATIDKGEAIIGRSENVQSGDLSAIYNGFLLPFQHRPLAGNGSTRAAAYALAMSEVILKNHPVITTPTCLGAAILPPVFRAIQEKFIFSDDKMIDGLMVSGLIGSLIMHPFSQSDQLISPFTEVAISSMMAAGGISFMMGGTLEEIERSATLAQIMYHAAAQKSITFEPASFQLQVTLVATTIQDIIDLSIAWNRGDIPDLDHSIHSLLG